MHSSDSHAGPFASAVALQSALRSGEITAVDAVTHYLTRSAAAEDLGAFVTLTPESALAEAATADIELREARRTAPTGDSSPGGSGQHGGSGQDRSLLGIPLAHKDIVDVAGTVTTSGSAAVIARPAATDHPVVAGLRAAGAISIGKTQVPEFGLTSYSENLVSPPARNPHDRGRTAGGSSGGAAAAVAAGLLPVAPGSDGGGSIRIPALACGLVGLKPGLGAVPGDLARGATDAFGAPTLTVSGPIARSAADAALLMDAMCAPAARGSHGRAVERAADLTGLTVAVSTESPFAAALDITLSPDARRAFALAAERLNRLGHRVAEREFHYDPEYFEHFTNGWIAGLSLVSFDARQRDRLMPLTREMRDRARARTHDQHVATAVKLHRFAQAAREAWGHSDVVLTPGLARAAPAIGEFTALSPTEDYALQCRWTPFTSMVNVAGLPAIAVPITTGDDGLPYGVQLIGRQGSEPTLLALAEQLAGHEAAIAAR